jgi:hypothetical protein
MEEEILQEMIQDRKIQIKLIGTKMELQSQKMERLKKELAEIRETYGQEHVEHTMSLDQSHRRLSKLIHQFKEALQGLDMQKQQQGTQLHVYNEVMKAIASPETRESSYVIRMQAQLCKAMHSMGMMETQLALVTADAADWQKYLKDSVTLTMEEKSQVELELMNGLIVADNSRREVETRHKGMIEAFTTEKDALVEKIEKQQEEAEKDEEEKEEEEDDDEEKTELQEILTQGREEIERMKAENKEEFAKLEELKAKVAAVRGETFVEELVSTISEEFKDDDEEEEDED